MKIQIEKCMDAVKTEKFITFNVYIKWKEIFTINDRSLQLRSQIKKNKPSKQEKSVKCKANSRINKVNIWLPGKINKIDKHLAKHVKK